MNSVKPKLPAEAIELYNLFIHGVISRRAFLDRRAEICSRRVGDGHGHRGADAEICRGAASLQDR